MLWSRTSKPSWVPHAVVGKDGWVHPVTNEVLVTFGTKGGDTIVVTSVTGTYTANETVTGGTSSATGKVASFTKEGFIPVYTLVLYDVVGTFQTGETLTGGSSSATSTSSTIVIGPSPVYTPTINSVTFYRGFNVTGDPIAQSKTAFYTGDYFIFAVQFNTQVKITGSPYITVNINSVARHAVYTPMEGFPENSATALFVYRLVAADVASASEVTVSSPINLNSGTIHGLLYNQAATLTFTPPTMSSVTVTSLVGGTSTVVMSGSDYPTFKLGDLVVLTATFDRAVTVSGTPEIAIDVNGTIRQATYASGSTTSALVFHYTVQSTDTGDTGEVSVASAINLNSGSIVDAQSTPVTLSFPAISTAGVIIDGVVPVWSSASGITNGTHYTTSQVVTLTLGFSKAVTVTGSPEVGLTVGSNGRELVYASGSGTNALNFTYTIVGGDSATAGNFTVASSITLNSGTIKDDAGNALSSLTITPPTTTTVLVN